MVGGVVAALAVVIVIAALLFILHRRRANSNKETRKAVDVAYITPARTERENDTNIESQYEAITFVDRDGITAPRPNAVKQQPYENVSIIPDAKSKRSMSGHGIRIEELVHRVTSFTNDDLLDEYEQLSREGQDATSTYVNTRLEPPSTIAQHDESRVVLIGGKAGKDGINASYITGFKDRPKHYIATNVPGAKKMAEFWQMVWQEKSERIVMLENLPENSRTLYWSDTIGQKTSFGSITVQTLSSLVYSDYAVRKFQIAKDDSTREVTQLQFTTWPEDAVPEVQFPLLSFRRRVHSLDDCCSGPIIVHCSAGVGRTGTFIAIDYLLEQAEHEGEIDVFKYALLMRSHRMNMIQTLEQYKFIYLALSDAILTGVTAIPSRSFIVQLDALTQLHQYGRSQLYKQFEMLNTDLVDATQTGYYQNIHPGPNSVVASYVEIMNNSYFVDTFKSKTACVATSMPVLQNLNEFWSEMFTRSCRTIIMLNELDDSYEICMPYWPEDFDEPQTYGEIQVTLLKKSAVKGFTMREFAMKNINRASPGDATVKHFHLTGWPDQAAVPADTDVIMNLMTAVNNWHETSGDATVVHGKESVLKTGLYCSAAYVIEKLKKEQEVDVFTSVRQMRLSRPQLVVNLEQYRFLHTIAASYIKTGIP